MSGYGKSISLLVSIGPGAAGLTCPSLVLKGCVITWAAQALKIEDVATVNVGELGGGELIQSSNGELRGEMWKTMLEGTGNASLQTCIALITSFLNLKAGDQLCLNTLQMGEGVMGGWVLPIPPEQW